MSDNNTEFRVTELTNAKLIELAQKTIAEMESSTMGKMFAYEKRACVLLRLMAERLPADETDGVPYNPPSVPVHDDGLCRKPEPAPFGLVMRYDTQRYRVSSPLRQSIPTADDMRSEQNGYVELSVEQQMRLQNSFQNIE